MSTHRPSPLAVLAVTFFCVAPAFGNPGISITCSPSPPNKVFNDGTSIEHFDWRIEYLPGVNCTPCNPAAFTFEILDSTLTPLPVFPIRSFSCLPSPINHLDEQWVVPAGQAVGNYYGRVTFYSDWMGTPCGPLDMALTGFIVQAGARFKVCKFKDLNGNGIQDAGDPPLSGWLITATDTTASGGHTVTGTTGGDGCVVLIIEVNPTPLTTPVTITETIPAGWKQTAPNIGGNPQNPVNPVIVNMVPGPNPPTPPSLPPVVTFGNWQPIVINGFKFIDQAPWPWTSPPFAGALPCQKNTSAWEPLPSCSQPSGPDQCDSPTQPGQIGIEGVTVTLTGTSPVVNLNTTTDSNGFFTFGPIQWQPNLHIIMSQPAADAPLCNPPVSDVPPLTPWPGTYVGKVATSPWTNVPPLCPRIVDFVNFHDLNVILPTPVKVGGGQVYGCNYFFNWHPARLFGKICADTLDLLPTLTIGVKKEGCDYIPPSVTPDSSGLYQIPPVYPAKEPQGIRPGTYRLTLSQDVPDPTTQAWQVTTYCDSLNGTGTIVLPKGQLYIDVGVAQGADVRVDFCITSPPSRRCFLPVTFTQQGWHNFCNPTNGIIEGGMVYNRFPIAFAQFKYYGPTYTNKVIIGKNYTVAFDGTSPGLNRLCAFLPQSAQSAKLITSYVNPTTTSAGKLAGETLAVQMNIAYNDVRVMPRTPGYDLEEFRIASGIFKGRRVGEIRDIANQVLGGSSPCQFGLQNGQTGYDQLCLILETINKNYEFVNYNMFNDRGFLIPDRALGQPDPPTIPTVPQL